jgi:hypothetical protein
MRNYIKINFFAKGILTSSCLDKKEKEGFININHISEIGEIEKFNGKKYFSLTMSNNSRYFMKPKRISKLFKNIKLKWKKN